MYYSIEGKNVVFGCPKFSRAGWKGSEPCYNVHPNIFDECQTVKHLPNPKSKV
jgi:hypothetical protein